ncbi:MAG: hypothetical protein Q4B42_00895 [Oscillospiraceae bacterium]|nr:hypothetical protein [Oscillospiraceae bacterium]
MKAYLKRRSTFKTYAALDAIEWKIAQESIYDNVSSIEVKGEYSDINGDFFICDGFIGVVRDSAPENGQTKINCNGILTAFSRDLIYPGAGVSTEDFIASQLTASFGSVNDEVYAMPYLEILTPATSTSFIKPDIENDYLYNLKSYIALARRLKSVFTTFAVEEDRLTATIAARAVATHNIDFAEAAHELTDEKYSDKSVAKITAVVEGVGTDYFLMADGTITTNPGSDPRASGTWETLVVKDASKVEDTVADQFAKNSHSHSIEFYTSKRLGFYDKLNIRLHGAVVTSYVSQIIRTHKDDRYLIKSGELRVTMTEKSLEVI